MFMRVNAFRFSVKLSPFQMLVKILSYLFQWNDTKIALILYKERYQLNEIISPKGAKRQLFETWY